MNHTKPTAIIFTTISALILHSCASTKLSKEAGFVRAMTLEDKPNCSFIANVGADGNWLWNDVYFIDSIVDDVFNDALNTVASVGGDAYTISRSYEAQWSEMQAWKCGWAGKQLTNLEPNPFPPLPIFAIERKNCDFIKTIAEGSNWGFTKKRNTRNAREDAIKLVQQAGGDSYFVVEEIAGHIVVVIIEAWRCN